MQLLGMSFRLHLDSAEQAYVLQEFLKYSPILLHVLCIQYKSAQDLLIVLADHHDSCRLTQYCLCMRLAVAHIAVSDLC